MKMIDERISADDRPQGKHMKACLPLVVGHPLFDVPLAQTSELLHLNLLIVVTSEITSAKSTKNSLK